jgi:hypothetical protein
VSIPRNSLELEEASGAAIGLAFPPARVTDCMAGLAGNGDGVEYELETHCSALAEEEENPSWLEGAAEASTPGRNDVEGRLDGTTPRPTGPITPLAVSVANVAGSSGDENSEPHWSLARLCGTELRSAVLGEVGCDCTVFEYIYRPDDSTLCPTGQAGLG